MVVTAQNTISVIRDDYIRWPFTVWIYDKVLREKTGRIIEQNIDQVARRFQTSDTVFGSNGLENRRSYNTQASLRFSAVYRNLVTIRMWGGLLQPQCCQWIPWKQAINFKSSLPRFLLIQCICLRIHVNLREFCVFFCSHECVFHLLLISSTELQTFFRYSIYSLFPPTTIPLSCNFSHTRPQTVKRSAYSYF
jgi:hypothetical protein